MKKNTVAVIFIVLGIILIILGTIMLIYVETRTAAPGAFFGGGFASLFLAIDRIVKSRRNGR